MGLLTQNSKGAAGVLFLLGSLIIGTTLFMLNIGGLHQQRVGSTIKNWDKIVAREAARSAFILMEAALQRRLWESPPDNDCLKSESFSLSGVSNEGVTYSVSVTADAKNDVFTLISTADFNGAESKLMKSIKALDAADFLIYSSSKDPHTISRGNRVPSAVAGMIGGQRRIYFNGPVIFSGMNPRTDQAISWSDTSGANYQEVIGIILQAERLQFLGGVMYESGLFKGDQFVVPPDPGQIPASPAINLGNYSFNYGWQVGDLAAVITNDQNLAVQLLNRNIGGAPLSGSNLASYIRYIYPKALSKGSLPLIAESMVDSGQYMNHPNYWKAWSYLSGGGRFGNDGDYTCLTNLTVPAASRKICSFSEHFPNGYKSWVNDASLNNVVLGSDSPPLSLGKLSWDNMEALKEEANACGVVVTPGNSDSEYTDCSLSIKSKQDDYLAGRSPCYKVQKVDLENLSAHLKNFNPAVYLDDSKKDRFLRRVIYTEEKLELEQSISSGLWTSLPSKARENLSLWFVNEDQFVLKPHQPDQTSPLTVDPGRRRKAYFNQDPNNTLESLKMVFMSPEQIEIISPFHVPYSLSQLQQAYPVVGGKIQPKIHAFTDYLHQEDDGFKYGVRDIHLKNVTLIGSSSSAKFYLKGLWGDGGDSPDRFFKQTCMFSEPSSGVPRVFGAINIPGYVNTAGSLMPPTGSRFYNGAQVTVGHQPYVFRLQKDNGVGHSSIIYHEGLKLSVETDDFKTPRDLSVPNYEYTNIDDSLVDLSNRNFTGTIGYLQPKTNATCVPQNVMLQGLAIPIENALSLNTELSEHVLVQSAPPNTFDQVGSLFAVDLPTVEVK